MKKIIFMTLVSLSLFGCGSAPVADSPHFFNGYWYMTSGENCVKVRQMSPGRIMCSNEQNQVTGFRNALTEEQLRMYQLNLAYQTEQARQSNLRLQQTLQNASQAWQQQSQSILQNVYQNMQQPTPTFVNPFKKNRINCLDTGMLINCSY